MKYIGIIFAIIASTIEFWFERYESCQCFLLMALLYYAMDKNDKKGE